MHHLRIIFLLAAATIAWAGDTVTVPVKNYRGLPYTVQNRILSREGTQWIEACRDGILRFSNVRDSVLQREIPVSSTGIHVRYAPDFTSLIVTTFDSTIYRIDIESGNISQLQINKNAVWQITTFSRDVRKCISYVPEDSSRLLWDLQTGEKRTLAAIKGDTTRNCIRLSADAQLYMCLSGNDSTVRIIQTSNDSLLHLYHIPGFVRYGEFSNSRKQIVLPIETPVAKERFMLLLLDVETGATLWRSLMSANGNALPSWDCRHLIFSSDDAHLLSGNSKSCIVWDVATGAQLFSKTFNEYYLNLSFTPDEASFVVNWVNTGACTDTIAQIDIASKAVKVLHGVKEWPYIDAGGFSASGEDLYVGNYTYDSMAAVTGFTEWDSIVFWSGTTNKEYKKKIYQQQISTDRSSWSWFFTNSGTNLIRGYHRDSYDSVQAISVFNLGQPETAIYTRSLSGTAQFSADKKTLWDFRDSSYFKLDLATLDTETGAFAVPDSWEIKDIDEQTRSVLAVQIREKSSFDSVYVWANVWNYATSQSGEPFLVSKMGWTSSVRNIDAAFCADAKNIAVTVNWWDTIAPLDMFDITTGKKTHTIPEVKGYMDVALTPDRAQLLVGCATPSLSGIYCYDAVNGDLLRYYKTVYSGGVSFSYPFSYNPANPQQFMYSNKIWELPRPVAVVKAPQYQESRAFRILSATKNQLSFTMPNPENIVTITLYLLSGKKVAEISHTAAKYHIQSVALPDLSSGIYCCQVRCPGTLLTYRSLLNIIR